MTQAPILSLDRVSKRFGGLQCIDDLSFSVPAGSRTALIGPNGAGKTTVFNLITGVLAPDSGCIHVAGADITGLASRLRIRHGVARTFQNVRLMRHLTTLENVMVGQHWYSGGWRGILKPLRFPKSGGDLEEARAALAEAGLAEHEHAMVGSLPYGVQKRIEVVRALLARPRLLLLDEPAAGLNPAETEALQLQLENICRRAGVSLLVVEHDMHFVSALCNHVIVVSFGRKIAEGSADAIRSNTQVQEVYLGTSRPGGQGQPELPLRERRRAARRA